MESLPLKELDFRLQKSTGPSSGGVASIDCPGVSSAEVCATCLRCHLVIEVQYVELDFHELAIFIFFLIVKNQYLINTQFLYQQNAHFIL